MVDLGFSAGVGVAAAELAVSEEDDCEAEDDCSCARATPPTSKTAAARTLHGIRLDLIFLCRISGRAYRFPEPKPNG